MADNDVIIFPPAEHYRNRYYDVFNTGKKVFRDLVVSDLRVDFI